MYIIGSIPTVRYFCKSTPEPGLWLSLYIKVFFYLFGGFCM